MLRVLPFLFPINIYLPFDRRLAFATIVIFDVKREKAVNEFTNEPASHARTAAQVVHYIMPKSIRA